MQKTDTNGGTGWIQAFKMQDNPHNPPCFPPLLKGELKTTPLFLIGGFGRIRWAGLDMGGLGDLGISIFHFFQSFCDPGISDLTGIKNVCF
jgi:hypothetical protein